MKVVSEIVNSKQFASVVIRHRKCDVECWHARKWPNNDCSALPQHCTRVKCVVSLKCCVGFRLVLGAAHYNFTVALIKIAVGKRAGSSVAMTEEWDAWRGGKSLNCGQVWIAQPLSFTNCSFDFSFHNIKQTNELIKSSHLEKKKKEVLASERAKE